MKFSPLELVFLSYNCYRLTSAITLIIQSEIEKAFIERKLYLKIDTDFEK